MSQSDAFALTNDTDAYNLAFNWLAVIKSRYALRRQLRTLTQDLDYKKC